MARRLRITPCGLVYHVLNRANARKEIFHDSADYAAFERVMAEALARLPLELWHQAVREPGGRPRGPPVPA